MAACPGGWSSTRVSHEKGAKDLSSPQPFTMLCRLDAEVRTGLALLLHCERQPVKFSRKEQADLQPVLFISVSLLEQFAGRLVSVDNCRTHALPFRAPGAFGSDSTAHPM